MLIEGRRLADERGMERLAWQTALLLQCWGAKVTMNELLGRHEPSVEEKVEQLLRAQYKEAGKDPNLVPHLGPTEKLDRLMRGEWPQSAN